METLNKYVNMEAVAKYMNYETVSQYVNLTDPLLYATLAHVVFNPLAWNCVARLEYKTHFLTRLFRGHNKAACIFNGIIIFLIGLSRDFLYRCMLENQPRFTPLEDMYSWPYTKLTIDIVAGLLLVFGNTLVLGAYYQLGLIGTYLGDYFGILLPNKVSGFPFTISSSPMYDGSTINFLAFALYNRSIAGAFVALFVYICYRVACIFEEFVSLHTVFLSCSFSHLLFVCYPTARSPRRSTRTLPRSRPRRRPRSPPRRFRRPIKFSRVFLSLLFFFKTAFLFMLFSLSHPSAIDYPLSLHTESILVVAFAKEKASVLCSIPQR